MLADGDGHLCLCVEGQEHPPRFAVEGTAAVAPRRTQSTALALGAPGTPAGRQPLSVLGPTKADTDAPALLVIEVWVCFIQF